jgi:spore germination protein YaaH
LSLIAASRSLVGLAAVLALATGSVAQAATTPARVADPSTGVHARDDAEHAKAQLTFTPATTTPISRQPRKGAFPATRAGGAPVVTREVLGFAPYWSLGAADTWRYSLLTTVAYFGLDLRGDGSFDTSTSGWSAWNSQQFVNMVNAAHQSGDRVVIVIKCFDAATINQLVSSQSSIATAIDNTLNAIASKNLDGVNVDFEGTSAGYPGVQSGMTNFMTQLFQRVHQWRSTGFVSIDTYSGSASWDGGIFRIGSLAPVADAIFVMAYDMIFSDLPNRAGPNAPLHPYAPYNDSTAVAQYISKAPASKIVLGVPYYGYKWSTSSNQANGSALSGASAVGYSSAISDVQCAQANNLQLSQGWDGAGASPWAAWLSPSSNDPCGGNYGKWRELYYDNALSLGFKYDLVEGNRLQGTGMWALGYDAGSNDLWNELALKFGAVPGWESLGGVLTSGPTAAAWGPNRRDVFGRGSDGQLWHRWNDGGGWASWERIGGQLASGTSPAAVSWGPNRVDVMVTGTDHGLWHAWWDGTGWRGWEPLGGVLTASPAVASRGNGILDIFARGSDGGIWHKWWDGARWGGWESHGGISNGAPTATSRAQGTLDVLVRGSDNGLWHEWWDGARWVRWEALGGTLASAPATTSWGGTRLDVVALGPTNDLLQLYWQGQWSPWLSRSGVGTSDPAAVSGSFGNIDAFVRGTDNAAWHTGLPP